MATDPKVVELLRMQSDKMLELESHILALQVFSAATLAEAALKTNDPERYITDFSAKFLGFADGLSDVSPPAFSQAFVRLSEFAEQIVSNSKKPSKPAAPIRRGKS